MKRSVSHVFLQDCALLGTLFLLSAVPVLAGAQSDFSDGVAQYQARRYVAAENYFSRAVAQAPAAGLYRYYLATVLSLLGRTDQAIPQYRAAFWLTSDTSIKRYCSQALAAAGVAAGQPPRDPARELSEANSHIVSQIGLDMSIDQKQNQIDQNIYSNAVRAASLEYGKASKMAADFQGSRDRSGIDKQTASNILQQATTRQAEQQQLAQEWQKSADLAEQSHAAATAEAAANLQDRLNDRGNSGVRIDPVGTNLYVSNFIEPPEEHRTLAPLLAVPKRLPMLDPLVARHATAAKLKPPRQSATTASESVHARVIP